MKRKILIALAALLLIGGVGAGIALYALDRQYGWLPAAPYHHDLLATDETRLLASIDTLRLASDLQPYLPENTGLPAWLPWKLHEILPRALPREVAILGGSNFSEGEYDLTLFINEQRGGPALPDMINTQTQFRQSIPEITWDEPGFILTRRGVLTAEGHLELPFGVEDTILKLWSPDAPKNRLALHGGHMAEAVIDNRNGEIVALIGAAAPAWGSSLEALQQEPVFEIVMAFVPHTLDIRFAVDFKDVDTLLIQLRVNLEEEIRGQLDFFVALTLPDMAARVQQQYGLVMESETDWVPEDHTYIVDISLIGVEEKLKNYFRQVIPAGPAPAN